MKRILLAYQISGKTVGIDLLQWNSSDLNGNLPFKMIYSGDTIPSGYVDISSIENWDKFGNIVANDYLAYKCAIKTIVLEKGWNNLTNLEKDLAIKYYAYPDLTSLPVTSINPDIIYPITKNHKYPNNCGVVKSPKIILKNSFIIIFFINT